MTRDTIDIYNRLLLDGLKLETVINILPEGGWIRTETGKVKKRGGLRQRRASVVGTDDLVGFEFGERGMNRFVIECGFSQKGSQREFLHRWKSAKALISGKLNASGTSTDLSLRVFDQRCRWTVGEIEYEARASRLWYNWRIVLDARRRGSTVSDVTMTLEDLFI